MTIMTTTEQKKIRQLQDRVAWIYSYQQSISPKLLKWHELETEKKDLQDQLIALGRNENMIPISKKKPKKFGYRESLRLI